MSDSQAALMGENAPPNDAPERFRATAREGEISHLTGLKSPVARGIFSRKRSIREEKLSFRIRIVRNEEQLSKAVNIRAEAYERHWPNLYKKLQHPENQDRNPNSLIFLAERKSDSIPVGTMRVDTNLVTPLEVTRDLDLPEDFAGRTIAYVTRLGVKQGRIGTLVKLALFKSLHRYCLAKQLYWMLVGIRPPGDKDYVRLGFEDVYPDGKLRPIISSGGVPIRLMAFHVNSAERRWNTGNHPLYKFMCEDYHSDIEIFSSVSGMWSQPRRARLSPPENIDIFDTDGLLLI